MINEKTLVLRNLIIRDYSNLQNELQKKNEVLFNDFVELQYQKENYDFDVCLNLLNRLDDFLVNDLNHSQSSKKEEILNYIEKF